MMKKLLRALGLMTSVLAAPALLATTVGTATILGYLLLRGTAASKPLDERVKDDKYFRAILSEAAENMGNFSGTEQGCIWAQTDEEVEISIPLPQAARAKDCQCKVRPETLAITIQGSVVLQGSLFRRVQAEDADWILEDVAGKRVMKVTLTKSMPTKGTQHWTRLIKNDS